MRDVPPLIPITLALMCGITADSLAQTSLVWSSALILAGIACMAWRHEGALLLALGFGMFLHHVHRVAYDPNDVRNLLHGRPDYFECEGRITGDPIPRSNAYEERLDFPIRLESYREAGEWKPVRGKVWVEWRRDPRVVKEGPRLFWADRVRLSGYLERPTAGTNPPLFDYRNYLETQGFHYVLRIDPEDATAVSRLGSIPGAEAIFRARDRLESAVLRGVSGAPEIEGLLLGMILGQRSEMPPEVNENFKKTGTLHVVAISGLHITLIAFLITLVLGMFRLDKRMITLIVIPLLTAYVMMTGFRPSAVRALVMCIVFLGGWLLNRPAHMMNSLAVAAFIILAFAPYQLFDPGFQLSFIVVAAIVLLTPRFRRRLEPWIEVDPFLPREFVSAAQRRVSRVLGWGGDLTAVSLAAWIGSAGLILYYFHLFSPVSFFCNLVVVPLSGLSLALGFTAMLVDLVWPWLASVFNQSQWLVTRLMLEVTDMAAEWTWGFCYVARPSAWLVAAGYALCIIALFQRRSRRWIAACAMLGLAGFVVWGYATRPVQVTVLDVGKGQCIFVERFGGPKVLIDAGSQSQGRSVVEPFLRSRGVNRIDAVVATHGDASHIGGLIEIIGKMPVGELIVSPAKTRSSKFKQLLKQAEARGVKVVEVAAGDVIEPGGQKWDVLWPRAPYASKADDNSLVLRYGDLVFLSDLPQKHESDVAGPGGMTVVRGASSRECFSEPLLESTGRAIFSATDEERDDLVLPETLRRLRQRDAGVWITGVDGAIRLSGRPGDWVVEPANLTPDPQQ